MENKPLNTPFIPGGPSPLEPRGLGRVQDQGGPNFRDVLGRYGARDEGDSIRFSSNANQKLEKAGVELSTEEKARLKNGLKRWALKM